MSAWLFAAEPAAVALLALLLWRRGLKGRLFVDALAIGLTLGACIGLAEAPFELKRNPLHFSAETVAFLFAGLPEEGIKMLGAAAFLRGHWLSRSKPDVVLATGALALAFAALENVFYLANSGPASLALDRALTSTPFHVFEGLIGGYVVAHAPANAKGIALALLGWLGVGALHGVYDFAVFVGFDGGTPPFWLPRLVAALGLAPVTAMKALLALAEAIAAAAAYAALSSIAARSRTLGWLLGAPFALVSALALVAAGLVSIALETPDPLFGAAVRAVAPFGFGLMMLKGAPAAPMSKRSRRVVVALGGVALAAVTAAALVYGPSQWRQLTAMRYQARAARAAASGDDAAAVEALGRALEADPQATAVYAQRAGAEARLKRWDAALADIDAARRLAPREILLLKQRAEIDRQRNDPAATIADLGEALKLQPDEPEILAMRGEARVDAGDPKGAYADLAAASRIAADNAVVRRAFAAWDVDAGDFDAALKDLNARVHADPNDVIALFQRGRVWLYKGAPEKALADFERADRDPAFLYPALWRFLARAAMKQEGGAELLASLSKGPDKWPAPVARMLLGLVTPDAAKAAASDAGEACEVGFYAAQWLRAREGLAAAEAGLQAALQACPTGFIEHEAAKAELRRVGG